MRLLVFLTAFLISNSAFSQNYYLYVAAESDDMVSLLRFDGSELIEEERFEVGVMPTEIEGPHLSLIHISEPTRR